VAESAKSAYLKPYNRQGGVNTPPFLLPFLIFAADCIILLQKVSGRIAMGKSKRSLNMPSPSMAFSVINTVDLEKFMASPHTRVDICNMAALCRAL
jgi:hypothetical protein